MLLRSGKTLKPPDTKVVLIKPHQVALQEKPNNISSRITKKNMERILAKKTKDEVLDFAYSLPSLALKDLKNQTKKKLIQDILTEHKQNIFHQKKLNLFILKLVNLYQKFFHMMYRI